MAALGYSHIYRSRYIHEEKNIYMNVMDSIKTTNFIAMLLSTSKKGNIMIFGGKGLYTRKPPVPLKKASVW